MAKQKLLDSWLNKSNTPRELKALSDVRSLQNQGHLKPNPKHLCSICNTSGSLLACSKCFKLFHLSCLELSTLNLPLSEWPCQECIPKYNSSYIKQLLSSVETQTQEKVKQTKTMMKDLNEFQASKKIEKFSRSFPHLIKQGSIQYPIDDSILWSSAKVHQITRTQFPVLHFPVFPEEILPELISICDFIHKFRSYLNISFSLNSESLYSSLSYKSESSLSKSIHIALIKPLAVIMLKQEAFRKSSSYRFFLYKIKKTIPISSVLDHAYMEFIEFLFKVDFWQEIIQDYDKEMIPFFNTFDISQYYSLSPGQKAKVLNLIITVLLETKEINEECVNRHEIQIQLKRELSEFVKNVKGGEADDEETEDRVEKIKDQLKNVSVRTGGLGFDRDFNQYFYFEWDNKIYVRLESENIASNWAYYETRDEVVELIKALCQKGIREGELADKLEELLENDEILNDSADIYMKDSMIDEGQTAQVYRFEDLVEHFIESYRIMNENFDLKPSESFVDSVKTSTLDDIAKIMMKFHLSFRVFHKSDEQSLEKIRNFWDTCELYNSWQKAVNEASGIGKLILCSYYLRTQVSKFCMENRKKAENMTEIARKSYKFERLKRLRKAIKTNEDECYLCDEAGVVICCDKCSKVAHLNCLGLERIPEGDWICPVCIEEAENIRITRSKKIIINTI